jgi:hypothetical protein
MEGHQKDFGFAWVRNPALNLPTDLLTPFLYSLLFALAHYILVKYVFRPYALYILPPPPPPLEPEPQEPVTPKLRKRGRPRKSVSPAPVISEDGNAKKREKVEFSIL